MSKDKYRINMCSGPLLKQIITFSIPLILSALLQFAFNAADLMVVGKFASHQDLAAVGATSALTMLILNIFLGISVGTNVVVARYIGEQNRKETSRTVHTAILFSLIGGAILAIGGLFFNRTFLLWMDTPLDILDKATLYMNIYFLAMPVVMLYNFTSAILRALGDTKRPFYFLVFSGIVNVVLNIIFVCVFKWAVAGVAIATVIAIAISALLSLRVLIISKTSCRVKLNLLKISWKHLKEMTWIGVPAGFQGACFSLSNILIQSAQNTFGSAAIAGITASVQWEFIAFIAATSVGQACVSFVGQNYGGKQYKRIRESIKICYIGSCLIIIVLSTILYIFRYQALSMFNSDSEVIKWGIMRFSIVLPFLFVCGIQEITLGALRGLGFSVGPTIVMVFGVCVLRIIWLYTVFKIYKSMESILWSYPTSWIFVAIATTIYLLYALKKIPKQNIKITRP